MAEKTPEELAAEQAQLKAQEEAKELAKKNKTEALRELSKELGIDAFKPEEIKSKFDEFAKWQEATKSEQEKLQEKLKQYQTKEQEFNDKILNYEKTLAAVKLNIDPDKIDKAFKLADNDPTKLEDVIKEFPSFLAEKKKVEVNLKQQEHKRQEGEISPILAAWRKKRGL